MSFRIELLRARFGHDHLTSICCMPKLRGLRDFHELGLLALTSEATSILKVLLKQYMSPTGPNKY